MTRRHRDCTVLAAALVAISLIGEHVFAACGAAFCTLSTTPEAAHERLGQIRFDLSYEYVDQDAPYSGNGRGDGIQQARLPDGDVEIVHRELNSVGHRLGLRTSAGIAERVTMEIYVPVVVRSHEHFAFEGSEPEFGKFSFSGVSDITVSGRYSILAPLDPNAPTLVVGAGFKAPTGSTEKTGRILDADQQLSLPAERSIQLGSGSWDPILSAYYLQRIGKFSMFVNGTVQLPTADSGYEFGNEGLANIGASYPVLPGFEAILQFNTRLKGRDRSREESELFNQNTGGEFLFLTPGIRAQLGPELAVYSFVQVPVYRHVNGSQLTADWSVSVGLNYVFSGLR